MEFWFIAFNFVAFFCIARIIFLLLKGRSYKEVITNNVILIAMLVNITLSSYILERNNSFDYVIMTALCILMLSYFIGKKESIFN